MSHDTDSAEAERERQLQALMLADLGTARRDRYTTADNNTRARPNLQGLESQREFHVQGSEAQRRHERDESILSGWNTLYESVEDTDHLENLPDIASGQSHRAALNQTMRELDARSPRRGGHALPFRSRGRGGGVAGTRGRGSPMALSRTTSVGTISKPGHPGLPQRSATVSFGLDPALNSNNDPSEDDSFRGKRGNFRGNRGAGRARANVQQRSPVPFQVQSQKQGPKQQPPKPQVQKPQGPAIDFSNKMANPASFMSSYRRAFETPSTSKPENAPTQSQQIGVPVPLSNTEDAASIPKSAPVGTAKASVSVVPIAQTVHFTKPKTRVMVPADTVGAPKTPVPVVSLPKTAQSVKPKAQVTASVAPVETPKVSIPVTSPVMTTQSVQSKSKVTAPAASFNTPKKPLPAVSNIKAVQYAQSKLDAIRSEPPGASMMGRYVVETPTPPPRSADSRKAHQPKKSKPKHAAPQPHELMPKDIGPPSKEIEWKVPPGVHPRKKEDTVSGPVTPVAQAKKKPEAVERKLEFEEEKPPVSSIPEQQAAASNSSLIDSLLDTANVTIPGQALQVPITATDCSYNILSTKSPGAADLLGLTFEPEQPPPNSIDEILSRTAGEPVALSEQLERLISRRLDQELKDRFQVAQDILSMPSEQFARFENLLNQHPADGQPNASFTAYRSPSQIATTDSSSGTDKGTLPSVRISKVPESVDSSQKVGDAFLRQFSDFSVASKTGPALAPGDSIAVDDPFSDRAVPVPTKAVSAQRPLPKKQTLSDSVYAPQPAQLEPPPRVLSRSIPEPHDPRAYAKAGLAPGDSIAVDDSTFDRVVPGPKIAFSMQRELPKKQTIKDSIFAAQPGLLEPPTKVLSGSIPDPQDPKAYATASSVSSGSQAFADSLSDRAVPAPTEAGPAQRPLPKKQTLRDFVYSAQPARLEPTSRVLSGSISKPQDPQAYAKAISVSSGPQALMESVVSRVVPGPTKAISAQRPLPKKQPISTSIFAAEPERHEPPHRVFSGNTSKPPRPGAYGVQLVGPAPYDPMKKHSRSVSLNPSYRGSENTIPVSSLESERAQGVKVVGVQPYNANKKYETPKVSNPVPPEPKKAAPVSSHEFEPAPRVQVRGMQPYNPKVSTPVPAESKKAAPASSHEFEPAPRVQVRGMQPYNPIRRD